MANPNRVRHRPSSPLCSRQLVFADVALAFNKRRVRSVADNSTGDRNKSAFAADTRPQKRQFGVKIPLTQEHWNRQVA